MAVVEEEMTSVQYLTAGLKVGGKNLHITRRIYDRVWSVDIDFTILP